MSNGGNKSNKGNMGKRDSMGKKIYKDNKGNKEW